MHILVCWTMFPYDLILKADVTAWIYNLLVPSAPAAIQDRGLGLGEDFALGADCENEVCCLGDLSSRSSCPLLSLISKAVGWRDGSGGTLPSLQV